MVLWNHSSFFPQLFIQGPETDVIGSVSRLSAKCTDLRIIIPIKFIFYATVWLIFLNTLYNITSPIDKPSKVSESMKNESRVSWLAFKPSEAASPSPSGQLKPAESCSSPRHHHPCFSRHQNCLSAHFCLFLIYLPSRCKVTLHHQPDTRYSGIHKIMKILQAYSLYHHPSKHQAGP